MQAGKLPPKLMNFPTKAIEQLVPSIFFVTPISIIMTTPPPHSHPPKRANFPKIPAVGSTCTLGGNGQDSVEQLAATEVCHVN